MRPHLFTLATVVSMLVCFAMALAFLFRAPEQLHVFDFGHGWGAAVWQDGLAVAANTGRSLSRFIVWALPFAVVPIGWLITT